MAAFDTHKAVKALCSAGFDDAQAEAVVDQINGAIHENVATRTDIDKLATKEELREEAASLATKADLERCASKVDLERFATKEELRDEVANLATKANLERCASKVDLERFATKEELREEVANLATKEELREEVANLATKEELIHATEKLELRIDIATSKNLKYIVGAAGAVVGVTKLFDLLFA